MAEQIKSGMCEVCDKQVMVKCQGINHILHLILSIITAGLWIIVWIGISAGRQDWRCSQCGSQVSSDDEHKIS